MIVAFFHVDVIPQRDSIPALKSQVDGTPEIMIQSVRKAMPGVKIIQLTDMTTKALPADEVVRQPWDGEHLVLHRFMRYAEVNEPCLFLDTDIIVRDSLEPEFELGWGVMVTRRTAPVLDPNGNNITGIMPYNSGVIGVKDFGYLRECVSLIQGMGEDKKLWWGEQHAMAQIQYKNKYDVPIEVYNYTPMRQDESFRGRKVLHLKGERKSWMPKIWGEMNELR
jgi:hypothetical protein